MRIAKTWWGGVTLLGMGEPELGRVNLKYGDCSLGVVMGSYERQ